LEDWGPGGVTGAARATIGVAGGIAIGVAGGTAIEVAGGAVVGVAGDVAIGVAGFSSLSLVLIRLDINWLYLSLYSWISSMG
jgi:hypothetical protein